MTNVIPFRRPRELAHVLADILIAKADLERTEREWYRTHSDEASDRSAVASDRLLVLHDEARAMIGDACGVPWDAIEAVGL